MDKLKQWVALTVVGCLALLAAGWFLLVSPKRSEAADLRQQATAAQTSNDSARTKLAILKAQAKDLPKKQAELAGVASKIPDNPALPSLIRALDQASADAGVELVSIAPGTPAAADATAAGGAATAPTAPATPAPAGGVGTLAAIPVSINVVGGYFEVQQFLSSVEDLPRALRVTNLTLAPGANPVSATSSGPSAANGRSLAATITGQVYMAAGAAAATPQPTPVQPTPVQPTPVQPTAGSGAAQPSAEPGTQPTAQSTSTPTTPAAK